MKIKELLGKLLKKIKEAIASDSLRRRVLFYVINCALCFTALVMSIVNVFTHEYILLVSTVAFSVACLLNIIALKFLHLPEPLVYVSFCLESLALLFFFIISGIPNGFSALWICIIPSFGILVFGLRHGSIFSGVAFILLILLFWFPFGQGILQYDYTKEFMLRFPFFYLCNFVISLVIELIRMETQRQLEDTKRQYYSLYRHDALTGLYNRYGIYEFVKKHITGNKNASGFAVVMFDIDDFKALNDKYGHEFGDKILTTVGNLFPEIVCEHCRCSRWGGEEFLLIMQCKHNPFETSEKIRKALNEYPFECHGEKITVTLSSGVYIVKNTDSLAFNDIVARADKALYQSKANGKNQTTVYEE